MNMQISETFKIDNNNGKKGTKAMCLINKLCPLGRVFNKHLWNHCKTQKRHFAYGYTKGRRREQAILIQSQTSWKLRNLGINHTKSMRDIANAFPSIAHKSLNDMLDKVTDQRSAKFSPT